MKSLNFDFCMCLSKIVVKRGAVEKKGMLPCCKCLFKLIGAFLAHFQAENLLNVQNMGFLDMLESTG